jgi:hypothetical protein
LTFNIVLGTRRAAALRKEKLPMDSVLRITGIYKIVTASRHLVDGCQGQRALVTDRKLDKNKA